jgi:outer membrane receptor protein involved in Fe transport
MARQVENLASRIFFSIYHTWVIKDKVRLSPGTSVLNLLEGDAVDYLGGRREHRIRFEAGLYKGGFGVRVDADWNSATLLQDPSTSEFQNLNFDDYAIANLRIFADLQELLSKKGRDEWLKGMRATFKIDNIFNQRPLVQTNEGLTPIRYQGPFFDPLGRVISISIRKTF